MKVFYTELFDYSHHFNQQLTDLFLENQGKISEKSIKLFNHILNAHQIWNNRISAKYKTFGVWELHPMTDLKSIDQMNYEQTKAIVDQWDFNEVIHYTTNNGKSYSNTVQDILFHVINHSTYHRGQIASELRQQGIEPIMTDFIFYKR